MSKSKYRKVEGYREPTRYTLERYVADYCGGVPTYDKELVEDTNGSYVKFSAYIQVSADRANFLTQKRKLGDMLNAKFGELKAANARIKELEERLLVLEATQPKEYKIPEFVYEGNYTTSYENHCDLQRIAD